jgi:hypothetical protein
MPFSYFGAAAETYRPDTNKLNRFSPLVGAELRILPELKFFTEYRYVSEDPHSSFSRSDFRVGFIAGLWREHAFNPRFSLYSDSYGELISISRISSRPALTAFSKIGPRYRILPMLSGDIFLEAYGRDSDDLNLGRRALELRYGARSVCSLGKDASWALSLAAFRRFVSFRDAPDSRWRGLLAIGGSL